MTRLTVTALKGPDRGRAFHFVESETIFLGRAGTPDVRGRRPRDPYLSRVHLQLKNAAGTWHVEVGSPNCPLFLNGRRTTRGPIADGDILQAGHTLFRVEMPAGPSLAKGELPLPQRYGLPRRRIDEFEVGAELGRGSMSVVHEARDQRTGRRLALKFLSGDPEAPPESVDYFLREMDIAAALEHPHLARPLCIGIEGAVPFLGMELIRGRTIADRIPDEGLLRIDDALRIGSQTLSALSYAHRLGYVHRDVKPSNVMACGEPGTLRAYLVDFGLSRSFRRRRHPTLTGTGELRGSLAFGAPECLRDAKRAGPRADVFGLGATLYFALSGELWFDEATVKPLTLLGRRMPALVPLLTRRSDVPVAVAEIIERALQAPPADRWPTAHAMRAALESAAHTGAA